MYTQEKSKDLFLNVLSEVRVQSNFQTRLSQPSIESQGLVAQLGKFCS